MVKLKTQDIDTKLNIVHIKAVKGLKDRQKFIITSASVISGGLRALWILGKNDNKKLQLRA